MIADCFPADRFYHDVSSKPEEMSSMDDDEMRIRRLVGLLLETPIGQLEPVKFQERLKGSEPFSSNMEIVEDELKRRQRNG